MGCHSEVVHCYAQIASLLSRMLQLALAKKWERLPELESQCASLVERLKRIEPLESLDLIQRDEVRRLASLIREDQETVTGLVRPQLERLIQTMSQLHNQSNLNRAYGPLS